MVSYPALRQVVLDGTDPRALAEFYRRLLGLGYRPGDEPPPAGEPDRKGADWLVLVDDAGAAVLATQCVDELRQPPGPAGRTRRCCTWTSPCRTPLSSTPSTSEP